MPGHSVLLQRPSLFCYLSPFFRKDREAAHPGSGLCTQHVPRSSRGLGPAWTHLPGQHAQPRTLWEAGSFGYITWDSHHFLPPVALHILKRISPDLEGINLKSSPKWLGRPRWRSHILGQEASMIFSSLKSVAYAQYILIPFFFVYILLYPL